MSVAGNESIYKYITRMAEENPGLPYGFQDVMSAGAVDVRFIFLDRSMSVRLKERMAIGLMDIVAGCMESSRKYEELADYLHDKPVFLYMVYLARRIKLMLSEELIDGDKLYLLGLKLAMESQNVDEVKLGLIIIGFFENDIVRQVIKTLGYHSDFTVYAVKAVENFRDYNGFIFDLCRNTCGYGRLASLADLSPVTDAQQKWLFEKGAKNEVAQNITAVMAFDKPEMEGFYHDLEITERNFSILSHIIAYAAEENEIGTFSHAQNLVDRYIDKALAHAKSFIDLAAVIVIERGLVSFTYETDREDRKGSDGSGNKESAVLTICNEILTRPMWSSIVIREMNSPTHQNSLVMMAVERMGLQPVLSSFLPLLERDLFDMDVFNFVLINHPDTYVSDVLDYLVEVLPEEIFTGEMLEMTDEEITPEFKPDIWLEYLLKELRRIHRNEEAVFIKSLESRYPSVRIEAIQALRTTRAGWSKLVVPALEEACCKEPVRKIRNRIKRLLGKSDQPEKEQRYVEVDAIKVEPASWDISLMNTLIAGTFHRDLAVMEGRIDFGDILFMMREPENEYDVNAILVTAEDGYVLGYIPRIANPSLAAMMDGGERLYAVFRSRSLDEGNTDIEIMLSKRLETDGKVIKFPKSEMKMRLPDRRR